MENIWNNFRTTVSAWSSSHQRRSNIDDTTKEHERTTDLQELKRITKRDSKKERRLKFRQCFERNNVIMTVKQDDIFLDMDDDEEALVDEDPHYYQGKLRIPRDQHTTVPNCCVICLEQYKPNDIVVWSTNEQCEHIFHRHCIVKYFDKIQRKVAETPCPCCRAKYTDMSVEIREKRRRTIRTTTDASTILSSAVIGLPSSWFR